MKLQEIVDKINLLKSDQETFNSLISELTDNKALSQKEARCLAEKMLGYGVITPKTVKLVSFQTTRGPSYINQLAIELIIYDPIFMELINTISSNNKKLMSNLLEYMRTTLKDEICNLEFSDKEDRIIALKRSVARLRKLVLDLGHAPISIDSMHEVSPSKNADYLECSMEVTTSKLYKSFEESLPDVKYWFHYFKSTNEYASPIVRPHFYNNLLNFISYIESFKEY